ncbi:hypothetical protein PIROE2DRAFT_2062 [Piromyces sp. E2]|nr:hypothetical protein PIROE2DRAFT_2062 [Piromyces sp. E2]|eukprot:OUM69874.1 hypothetical protein PIROE2DRAFT_2062 [Piromyces sp. E2]
MYENFFPLKNKEGTFNVRKNGYTEALVKLMNNIIANIISPTRKTNPIALRIISNSNLKVLIISIKII